MKIQILFSIFALLLNYILCANVSKKTQNFVLCSNNTIDEHMFGVLQQDNIRWKSRKQSSENCELSDIYIQIGSESHKNKRVFYHSYLMFMLNLKNSGYLGPLLRKVESSKIFDRQYYDQYITYGFNSKADQGNTLYENQFVSGNFGLQVFNFISSVEPFQSFGQQRGWVLNGKFLNQEDLEIQLIKMGVKTIKQFKKLVNQCFEIVGLIDLALAQPLKMERLKQFVSLLIDIEFEGLEPKLKKVQIFDPFQRMPLIQNQTSYEKYQKNIGGIVNFFVSNYKPEMGRDLSEIVLNLNKTENVYDKQTMRPIIDEKNGFSINGYSVVNQQSLKEYLQCEDKLKVCTDTGYYEKQIFYDKNYFDKFWQYNLGWNSQSCDVTFSFGMIKSHKQPHFNWDINHSETMKYVNVYCSILNDKIKFYELFQRIDDLNSHNFTSVDFLPRSYKINSKSKNYFKEVYETIKVMEKENNSWIYKPTVNFGGQGIVAFENLEQAKKHIEEKQDQKTAILQEYIQKVTQIYNKKFDIRNYVIIIWDKDSNVSAYYYEGVIRKSVQDYNEKDFSYSNTVTNTAQQMKFVTQDEDNFFNITTNTIDEFRHHLINDQNISESKVNNIFHEMKKIFTYMVEGLDIVEKKELKNAYTVFGMDMIIDQNLQPQIIEGNCNPGFSNKHQNHAIQYHYRDLISNFQELILSSYYENVNNPKSSENIRKFDVKNSPFELLVDTKNQYSYIKDFQNFCQL